MPILTPLNVLLLYHMGTNVTDAQQRVDKLDLAILECLALNCRLAHATIGDALGVAPNTITNRVLNLEREGIIRQFVMMIDLRPYGFVRNHVLLKFSSKSYDLAAQCKALGESRSAVWIPSYIGVFDTQVLVEVHDRLPISTILPDLFGRCKNQVQEYATYAEGSDLEFTHLLPNFNQHPKLKFRDDGSFAALLAPRSSPLPLTYKRQQPDKLDVRLLELLARDPRATLVSLATQLGCSRQTVSRRMQHLIESQIIVSFGVGVDYQRLGYTAYHLLFRLRPGLSIQLLQATFRGVPEVYYAGTAHGAFDLSVNLHCRTPQELGQVVQHIRKAFGTHVVHCDMLVYDRVHYWKQFTPAVAGVLGGA